MKTNFLLLSVVVAACATTVTQGAELKAGTICSGAATLNNGSVVTIGQPFVGNMSAPGGGVMLNAGSLPVITSSYDPQPQPTTITLGAQMQNGIFTFSFPTQSNLDYVVEASTDLTTWLPIRTNLGTGTEWLIQDTDAWRYSRRFYRVIAR